MIAKDGVIFFVWNVSTYIEKEAIINKKQLTRIVNVYSKAPKEQVFPGLFRNSWPGLHACVQDSISLSIPSHHLQHLAKALDFTTSGRNICNWYIAVFEISVVW